MLSVEPARIIESFENVLFREEGPGIVNWALEGLKKVLDAIYNGNGKLPMSPAQNLRVDDCLAQSESLESFIKEHVTKSESENLTKKEIRDRFADFCFSQGWDMLPKNEVGRRLPEMLKRLFAVNESNSVTRNGKHMQGYYGIGWAEITD